jgi:hypothetical protein
MLPELVRYEHPVRGVTVLEKSLKKQGQKPVRNKKNQDRYIKCINSRYGIRQTEPLFK